VLGAATILAALLPLEFAGKFDFGDTVRHRMTK
jgi:hypothetical protein